jgi:hypothetical protein
LRFITARASLLLLPAAVSPGSEYDVSAVLLCTLGTQIKQSAADELFCVQKLVRSPLFLQLDTQ